MCIPNRQLDPKARRIRVIGNVCLVAGLLLWNFDQWHWLQVSGQIERNWLHGVCGLLLGVSIGINLFGLRCGRRCGEKSL
jgi:hypothetical protein